MGNRVGKKKRIAAIAVIILISVFAGILFYWKIPSRRESMTWARSLNASEVSKIEMVVMPSAEDERYRSFGEEEFEDVVRLINKSAGRYTEDPDPLAGMSRTRASKPPAGLAGFRGGGLHGTGKAARRDTSPTAPRRGLPARMRTPREGFVTR